MGQRRECPFPCVSLHWMCNRPHQWTSQSFSSSRLLLQSMCLWAHTVTWELTIFPTVVKTVSCSRNGVWVYLCWFRALRKKGSGCLFHCPPTPPPPAGSSGFWSTYIFISTHPYLNQRCDHQKDWWRPWDFRLVFSSFFFFFFAISREPTEVCGHQFSHGDS